MCIRDRHMKKTALTIAGSDCSGGAGVQADIKTMEANGVYAMSVISVLTAQNTLGVQKLFPVSAECITAQIDSVFADIFPDAVKIGMPGTTELIQIIAERLRHYQAKHIVVDPVMLSSSGSTLVDEKAAEMINFCDAFEIPVLSLTNVKGFLTTKESEKKMAKAAAKLTYAFANADVPKVNLITGEAYGSAYTVMNSKAIGADVTYAWPDTTIGMMDASLAAKIIYEKQPELIAEKTAEYGRLQASAESAAKRGYVDSIIDPADTRKYLISAFEMLYSKRDGYVTKKHGSI